MKAMESMSVPAVVNNAVPSVPLEATRQRKEMPASKSSSPSVNVSAPATNSNNHNAPTTPSRTTLGTQKPTANIHYDQVMFVDGLGDTAVAPHVQSRAQRATLEEISQPIEVGTGATLPQPPSKRTGGLPLHPLQPASNVQTSPMATPASHETTTSNDSVGVRGREAFVSRRFDAPHVQPVTSTEPIVSRQVSPVSAPNTPVAPKFAPETPEQGRGAMKMPADLPSARHESFAATPQKNKVGSESFAASDSMAAKATTALPLPVAFTPSWEVDRFFWPEVVKQIEKSHADAFAQIGKHLSLANRDGLRVMAITSGERGVGRSTVAMHMARCAAASGLKVALVDGDTYCPSLIDQLRLDMQHGWQDCLFENVPLSEVAVHALADGITLFPLTSVVPPQQMHANLHRMAKMIKRISTAFDMVFIDASRLNLEQRDLVGVAQESIVDAAIVVVDTELSIKEKVDSAVSILQGMGISSIGLVENFQS
jgi:Mrp family chromosome partitioning ATPase